MKFLIMSLLRYSEKSGRGMFATRDIKMGEVIVEESPAIWGPKVRNMNSPSYINLILIRHPVLVQAVWNVVSTSRSCLGSPSVLFASCISAGENRSSPP
jgi:hypothetical protein